MNTTESNRPLILVIFGITGDLAGKKLLPALYHLYKDGLLHHHTRIIGLTRRDMSVDELLQKIEVCILEDDKVCDPEVFALFRKNLQMMQFDPANTEEYKRLHDAVERIEDDYGFCVDRLLYLSVPPSIYMDVITGLGTNHFAEGCQHGTSATRLLVEKPFGFDLHSASELIANTNHYFDESQVFRIDHYLAKGTAQNILTFRAANPLFSGIWNSRHISRIEITADESIGVAGRGGFYDAVGALRDLIQSHLLQLLALTTMELPHDNHEHAVHTAKQQLLSEIVPPSADSVHRKVRRGQYVGYGADVENETSTTETFVHLPLKINNDRWQDIEVIIQTGKKLADKETSIRLVFDKSPDEHHNTLTFRLQPNEGIDINLRVRAPGFDDQDIPAALDYDYQQAAHPDAYERVLVDAMQGEHALFASSEEVLLTWRILQPILDAWAESTDDLIRYEPGSTAADIA